MKKIVSIRRYSNEDTNKYYFFCPFCGSVNEFEDSKSIGYSVVITCEHFECFSVKDGKAIFLAD
jgi:hypothetical protein